MYVDNGKISGRQTFRLYVFDLMGIATLLLPPYLAKLCGCDGVWAIGIGSALGFVYLLYLGWVMKHMKRDIVTYLTECKSGFTRAAVLGFVGIHSLITAGFCAYVFTRLMQHSLIKEASYELILLVIVVMAVYAVSGGIECRARVYEVLFWFVLIPYMAMMLASVRDFETAYVDTFFVADTGNLLKGIYLVFLLVTPLFFSLFLIREKEKKSNSSIIKNAAGALLLTTIILLGSYVLLLGNFGAKSLSTMRFPVVTLMSTIQFEGNFLKRMDALMVAVWFFTLFALLNLHLHYGVSMGKELGIRKKWMLPISAFCIYGVAYGMQHMEGMMDIFLKYYSYVATPLMILLPGLLLLGKKTSKRGVLAVLLLCITMELGACGQTELEERCFPLLAGVDYEDEQDKVTFCAGFPRADNSGGSTGMTTELQVSTTMEDTFAKSRAEYEKNLNKVPDYNHLKVLVLGENFVDNPSAYNAMLSSLAENEDFPRNTYVCVVEDVEEMLQIDASLPQDLGSYLEEFLNNHEEKKNRMLTLGDLIDEKENQELVLYAPYLKPKETYVEWGGYYAIGADMPVGNFE